MVRAFPATGIFFGQLWTLFRFPSIAKNEQKVTICGSLRRVESKMAAPQAEWTLLGLAEFRAEVGLSQDQLKDIVGMARGTIVRIEGGGTAKNSTITSIFDSIYEVYNEKFDLLDLDVVGSRVYEISFKRKFPLKSSEDSGADAECLDLIGKLSLSLMGASRTDPVGFSDQVAKGFLRLAKGYIHLGGRGVALAD